MKERIQRLHDWYRRNVLDVPLSPEVERLWLLWLKQGFNGNDLRDVVLYLRRQISDQKRNAGSLKLSNLFRYDESGSFLSFAEDLALARGSRALKGALLEPMTEDEGGRRAPSHASPPAPAPAPAPETRVRVNLRAMLDEHLSKP